MPGMLTHNDQVVHYANGLDNRPRIRQAFEDYAHQHAEGTHPERAMIASTAQTANTEEAEASRGLARIRQRHDHQLGWCGLLSRTDDPDARLERLEHAVTATRAELATVQQQIGRLSRRPRDSRTSRRPAHPRTQPMALRLRHRPHVRAATSTPARHARRRPPHGSPHAAEHVSGHIGPDRDPGPSIGR
jgi:hypothetical protein